MGSFGKIKDVLRLSKGHPGKIVKAMRYLALYGYTGLRERLYREVMLASDFELPEQPSPGSSMGELKFSVLMPVYNVEKKWLSLAIGSVERQVYGNWELCIVDDCSDTEEAYEYLLSCSSDRVKVARLESNQGISAATNKAASMASGDYLVLLDNDDVLAPNALLEFYLCASTTGADVMYSDNDVIDEGGNRISVLCKPDWSPDLLLSQMYVGHLLGFSKSLFDEVGGFDSKYDGSQDYDLMFKLSEKAGSIEHISKILYSWRAVQSSTAANPDSKPYAQTAGLRAVQSHLDRTLGEGRACALETEDLFVYDVRYSVSGNPKASIIIPTKDHVDDLRNLISSIFEKTRYPNYEIVILDNNSAEDETLAFFEEIQNSNRNVIVERASYKFNWSRLNNQGILASSGDVIVCLNNDMEVISEDWLDRLVEKSLMPGAGVVGGLLLYPDGTIQHAGVVVGLGGWADHVYKGSKPVHYGNPFISPMVTRDVSAVTGACMAFPRSLVDEIGGFDENFIVCGSDVEFCLRAWRHGFRCIYDPRVRLTHFESKTRDPKNIPACDFRLSERVYQSYIASGDPFYSTQLDSMRLLPTLLSKRAKLEKAIDSDLAVGIAEIRSLHFGMSEGCAKRLNLLVPSINPEDVFGGISTALKLFRRLAEDTGIPTRIIVLDGEVHEEGLADRFPGYEVVQMNALSGAMHQIVPAVSRHNKTIPVMRGDWFLCTSWWSAYCVQEEMSRLLARGDRLAFNPILYLIQDYEPGFYSWSSRYALAESTYDSPHETIAVFNSKELKNHFDSLGYDFKRSFVFDPFLNDQLKRHLVSLGGKTGKRKQIMIYGRPDTDRNAFSLVVEGLRRWVDSYDGQASWDIVSAGQYHAPVYIGKGRYVPSVGKLSLDDYAHLLAESYAGISLMISPHPSYPPLEMASFGVKVVTNGYSGKDLSSFSENITSLSRVTPSRIAEALAEICESFAREVKCGNVKESYLDESDAFPFAEELEAIILGD